MGGISNNRLLFENNKLLFSLLFSGNFVGEQGLDGGGHSRDGGDPPTRENPETGCQIVLLLSANIAESTMLTHLTPEVVCTCIWYADGFNLYSYKRLNRPGLP